MSFYGSEPIPNTSAPQPSRQPQLQANAWAGTALDQLVFQENDNSLNPMGGLRRPSPQPQSNDPNFAIVDAATAELASYPSDPIDSDRFLLETARLDFDAAIQRRPTPSHLDQKPSRSLPAHTYRQPWERPGAGMSGSNISALPPEAFEIADELGLNPSGSPLSFAERGKHARKVGIGRYVQRLLDFNKERQRGIRDGSLEGFWKPLIDSYFTPDATLHIELKSYNNSKPHLIKLPVEALPRLWKSKIEAGMSAERMLLEDPCEFMFPSGIVVVDCPRTVIITTYQNRTVHTDGNLRVTFHRNRKISGWEFCTQKHEELFTRNGKSMEDNRESSTLRFGIPHTVHRLMMIANDVYMLKDRISEEISKIASDSRRIPGLQGLMAAAGESKQAAASPNFPGGQSGQNGSAFKALSSVIDGNQLDQSLAAAHLGMSLGRGGVSSGGRGLAGDLEMDIKNELESESNVVPNLREVFNTWGSEQQSSMMFPTFFDETVRPSFVSGATQDVQKSAGQSHGDLNLNPRKATSGLGDARATPQQSAIDAVAAAASGQGGWGVVAPTVSGMGNSTTGGEELDRSLQLLNAATDGNFAARHESGLAQRAGVPRQNAPPGLAMFTPQTNAVERGNEVPVRRERGSRGSRGAGAGTGRPTSGGQGMKEFDGSVRSVQRRLSSSKSKREAAVESGHGGIGGAKRGNFVGTSQGLADQNGAVGSGKNSSRAENAKNSKERGHNSVGNRRSAQRNSAADERLEKRQKTSAQNGEQK